MDKVTRLHIKTLHYKIFKEEKRMKRSKKFLSAAVVSAIAAAQMEKAH